jgi:type IV pilus assembly protein PilB
MDKSIDVSSEESPIVKLCNRILEEAVGMRVSDIHVEPMGDRVRLRYRIDGVCIERDNLPKRMQNSVLSRLKLMAGMNIAEKRIPQDGRIKIPVNGIQIDYRVSSCPAYHGESVVMRILRPDAVRIGLVNLGFEQDNLDVFNRIIKRPNGIFLVTGPTGSGKTTTLYSALDVLNRPDRKIITAEDPVEYNFEGINQCQVREGIGLTFPAILRSMLRQAPNIILVGEIRDREVGEIAIQAALTGHLVFSTLHTNDAAASVARLLELGVPNYLVNATLIGILAQRLVRTLCPHCKAVGDAIDPALWKGLVAPWRSAIPEKIYKPVGCLECRRTGYMGRTGLIELLVMTDAMRALIAQRADLTQLRSQAARDGLRSLRVSGAEKIAKGTTTIDEVLKAAPPFVS